MNLALRETWRGRVWRVSACRLVEERADGVLVLWHPQGGTVLRPFGADGRELRDEALGLVRPGSRWSIWLHRRDGRFRNWYVNFERDHVRTAVSLDHVDEKLDIVVEADGASRLKDEDELSLAAAAGYLDEAAVRAAADRVLAEPPWPTGWEDWRADPAWPAPELPEGWDVVD